MGRTISIDASVRVASPAFRKIIRSMSATFSVESFSQDQIKLDPGVENTFSGFDRYLVLATNAPVSVTITRKDASVITLFPDQLLIISESAERFSVKNTTDKSAALVILRS